MASAPFKNENLSGIFSRDVYKRQVVLSSRHSLIRDVVQLQPFWYRRVLCMWATVWQSVMCIDVYKRQIWGKSMDMLRRSMPDTQL